eukprot:2330864-Pyramimonas_sp.AAC.1
MRSLSVQISSSLVTTFFISLETCTITAGSVAQNGFDCLVLAHSFGAAWAQSLHREQCHARKQGS